MNGPSSLLSWKTSLELRLLTVIHSVKDDVEMLVSEYSELFTGLGKLRDYKVKLHVDDSVQPVAQPHRRDLEAQLKALRVIQQPTGPTPWVSPVICVPSPVICVCQHAKRQQSNKTWMPWNTNHQQAHEWSWYVTTFATHVSLWQFTRLNFGIFSAAEAFQEAIRQVLAGIPGVINLSDDILVFRPN